MEKQNWIDDITNSTDGIAKVNPNPALFMKIRNKIQEQEIVSSKWIWLAAASLTLLFLLNAKVVFSSKQKSANTSVESVANYLTPSNQLY